MKRIASGGGLFLIATVLGLLTAAAALAWLSREDTIQERVVAAIENTRPAVVAVTEIPAGARVTSLMIEVREIPDVAFLAGTPSNLDDVVGRVTRYPLVPGEQVSVRKLVMEGETTGIGLAFSVPPGMRAYSVSINEVRGSGGNIVPGDRVDVLVHTEYERLFGPFELATTVENQEKRHPTTITVVQNVLVLAVAQKTTPPIDGQRDEATLRPDEAEVQPSANSVTLAVTPDQAQALFFASQEGTIGLSLRSFGDTNTLTLDPLLRLEPLGAPSTGLAGSATRVQGGAE
jgi:pilus assembly protein CpaB